MWFDSRQKQAKQKGNANTEKRISYAPKRGHSHIILP